MHSTSGSDNVRATTHLILSTGIHLASLPQIVPWIYSYRGDGLRASKTVGTTTTTYTWDLNAANPVVLQDGTYTYVYGYQLISQTDNAGNQTYFLGDDLGSTKVLTDANGNVTAQAFYDVFGNVRSHSGTASSEYLFAGQEYDSTLGYLYLRARYYDPTIGRFISNDPLIKGASGSQGYNRYAYVANDPTNLVDASGLDTEDLLLGNLAHALIEFYYRRNHPGSMTEFTYSVGGPTKRIDIVDPRALNQAVFWEIKPGNARGVREGTGQIQERLLDCGAAFQARYGFSLTAGTDYEGLDLDFFGLRLQAWQSEDVKGLILYQWSGGSSPFPWPVFFKRRRGASSKVQVNEPVQAPTFSPLPVYPFIGGQFS